MSNPATKKSQQPQEKTTKSNIDAQIAELNEQIEWFYSDDFVLGEAVAKYRTATALAKSIEQDLNELKNEIEILSQDFSDDL